MKKTLLVCLSSLVLFFSIPAQAAQDDVPELLRAIRERLHAAERVVKDRLADGNAAAQPDAELAGAYKTMARQYAYLGDYRRALAVLNEAIRHGQDGAFIQTEMASVSFRHGQWERTDRALEAVDASLEQELAIRGDPEDYLTSRADWSALKTMVALARRDTEGAIRWAEATCNYMRLVHWQDLRHQPLAAYLAQVRRFAPALSRGESLPAELEALSCDDIEPTDSLYALIARARAGLPVTGAEQRLRYGPPADAVVMPDVAGRDGHPLYRHFVELFLDGTPVSQDTIEEQQRQYVLDMDEKLDRLCEAYYYQGMYFRYVKHDEINGRLWLQKAVDTWSLMSLEYTLARFELGLPPRPSLPQIRRGPRHGTAH